MQQKIEALKERLQKASWVQEEDKEAELRYEKFLMLQALSKNMTKFYQNEFGKDGMSSQSKFRQAVTYVRCIHERDEDPKVINS